MPLGGWFILHGLFPTGKYSLEVLSFSILEVEVEVKHEIELIVYKVYRLQKQ